MDPDVYYISGLPSEVHPSDVVRIGLAALILTFVATVYPARQAALTQPAEALRYE
jgi:lipoprotein-releasing system permease protein